MDEKQKEFLRILMDCGISANTLMAVGSVINTPDTRALMARRILEAVEMGEKMSDSLILNLLTNMMKEATQNSTSSETSG